jgi:hypothetical protein
MNSISREKFRDHLCRKFVRYHFRVDAEIAKRSTSVPCRVTDISREGMYIEVDDPPRVGASFNVRLALNVPLRLECLVRRVVPGAGVGVTFRVRARDQKRFGALLLALGADDFGASGVAIPPPERLWSMIAANE